MSIELPRNLATAAPSLSSEAKIALSQTTSGDILKEAHQLKQTDFSRPQQTIQDLEELRLFQNTKRREYEQHLNKNRLNYGQWMRYARWEIEHNHDFKRARSIMERALEVNVQHVPFWVRYIEMELMHKNVNHARNLLDRGVTTLPYCEKLWFLYVQTEESLGNFQAVRNTFERWLQWKPGKPAWESYIGFERRYDEHENVREIFKRMLGQFNEFAVWLEWVNFEKLVLQESDEQTAQIRGVYEAGADYLAHKTSQDIVPYFRLWSLWEGSVGENERGRAILEHLMGLPHLLNLEKSDLLGCLTEFEKLYGSSSLKGQSSLKRELKCEAALAANKKDYDTWWELIKIREQSGSVQQIQKLFEEAVSTWPEDKEKLTVWRRYIFLWIKYALWEEFKQHRVEQAREVWKRALAVMSKQKFTFGKLWIMAAEFELRHGTLMAARKMLGRAIGTSSRPKNKIFRFYISVEDKLGQLDRVRQLYEKWIEVSLVYDHEKQESTALKVLEKYVEFEQNLGETGRCEELFEKSLSLGRQSSTVLAAEVGFRPWQELFGLFIQFLKDQFLYDRARSVFREQLELSNKDSMWVEFALFELTILNGAQLEQLEDSDEVQFAIEEPQRENTRRVFQEAYKKYKEQGNGPSAIYVLDSWKEYEKAHGDAGKMDEIEKKKPEQVLRRKNVEGTEEVYYEYIFAAEKPDLSKFLANAKKWAGT